MVKIIRLNNNRPDVIKECVTLLKNGAVLVLPFDTVYGFCCDAKNDKAIKKIYQIKNRNLNKTIGVAVGNYNQLSSLVDISKNIESFIKDRVPGPYTFILNSRNNLNLSLSCQKEGTIAIRIPQSNLILELISSSGLVLAQTSANSSGENPVDCIEDLIKQLGDQFDQIDLVVDAGKIENAMPSKIFNLTGPEPKTIERS